MCVCCCELHMKESPKGSLFVCCCLWFTSRILQGKPVCLLLLCASHQRILQGKPVSLFVVVVCFTYERILQGKPVCLLLLCASHMKESSKGETCVDIYKKLWHSIECPVEWYISHRFSPPQLHVLVVECCCVLMCVPFHTLSYVHYHHVMLWTLPATYSYSTI